MADFFEIDFLAVETKKSGDAISLRYSVGGERQKVHVVDGGYLDTGDALVASIKKHYGDVTHIDNVVLTHTDRDHVNGLQKVLENFTVGTLWMNRPWIYAPELIKRFTTYSSVERLVSKLRSVYGPAAELEELAIAKRITIADPLQGAQIGQFRVLAPSRARYLQLITDSDRTPAVATDSVSKSVLGIVVEAAKSVANLVKAAWGQEYFPVAGTSEENEMSVIQYAEIAQKRILLTGDAGRDALTEAANYLRDCGVLLPGIAFFQVPHHGGRHNVNTEVLNRWLGPKMAMLPQTTSFVAVCSSAKADEHHPKNSVIRAILHRGGHFSATEGRSIHWSIGIVRDGVRPIPQHAYPDTQEEYE